MRRKRKDNTAINYSAVLNGCKTEKQRDIIMSQMTKIREKKSTRWMQKKTVN